MNLIVKPAAQLKGTVRLPASKSYSIRAYLIAACGGRSTVIDPSNCDDAIVAKRLARSLGSRIKSQRKGDSISSEGLLGRFQEVNVGESGTALRFLLPLLGLRGRPAKVIGKGTLRGRPNLHLTRALRKMGLKIKGSGPKESVPIVLKGGMLKGGSISIDGGLSSQFVSALLIACPQLCQPTRLLIKGKNVVSTDYITMTLQVLKAAGINIIRKSVRDYRIKANQRFRGLGRFAVPSDYGLAAFSMASALLNDSNVVLKGHLTRKFVQADGHIIPLLRKMGARFSISGDRIHLRGPVRLRGGTFSLKNCPDLVPIMSVLALFAKGKTRLVHIGHVRSKESDRITDLRRELLKVGAHVTETQDSLTVTPQKTYKPDRTLDPHRDHRLAMAFCVLGTKIGVRVKDIECTRKSYPDFVRDFKRLGAKARKS